MRNRRVEFMVHVTKTISYSHDYPHSSSPFKMFKPSTSCRAILKIFRKCPITRKLMHHHSRKRFVLHTVSQKIHKVLVVYLRQRFYLHNDKCVIIRGEMDPLEICSKVRLKNWNERYLMRIVSVVINLNKDGWKTIYLLHEFGLRMLRPILE